jgi:hypothetical protein
VPTHVKMTHRGLREWKLAGRQIAKQTLD